MNRLIGYILIIFSVGCSSGQQETVGQITQRRLQPEGKLMITYRFQVEDKWVYDSMELRNQVIPHDSITVKYSPKHPEESSLQLP